ncbi:unnamed protein product [Victoria cruziana]
MSFMLHRTVNGCVQDLMFKGFSPKIRNTFVMM